MVVRTVGSEVYLSASGEILRSLQSFREQPSSVEEQEIQGDCCELTEVKQAVNTVL